MYSESVYVYGQDGEVVTENIINQFALKQSDFKYLKQEKKEVFDFVGFIFKDGKLLTVFPKHFFDEEELENLNKVNHKTTEIKLLFSTMLKYYFTQLKSGKAEKYIGKENIFISDYPFASFFNVYHYYKKYGLYNEIEIKYKPDSKGKVSWKKTIEKSNIIVSNMNLIYYPLFSKHQTNREVFITDCMEFVLCHTFELFSDFINIPKQRLKSKKFDFVANIDYVINKLYTLKSEIFKDIHKDLLNNLISFFEQYRSQCMGGKIHFKINYFNLVWENMIEEYLNLYFEKYDINNNKIIFDKTRKKSNVHFKKVTFVVDDSINKFSISLDHFAYHNKCLYIFDSKYYLNVKELNYKQFSYNEILRYYYEDCEEIYSVLILPAKRNNNIHFKLNEKFKGIRDKGITISECFLNIKEVMQSYIQNK